MICLIGSYTTRSQQLHLFMKDFRFQHFGQIPCLTVDGFELVQSNAIMRYLGRELGKSHAKHLVFNPMSYDWGVTVHDFIRHFDVHRCCFYKHLDGLHQPFKSCLWVVINFQLLHIHLLPPIF